MSGFDSEQIIGIANSKIVDDAARGERLTLHSRRSYTAPTAAASTITRAEGLRPLPMTVAGR